MRELEQTLKCAALLVFIVAGICGIDLEQSLKSSVPRRIDDAQRDLAHQIDSKFDPAIRKANALLDNVSALSNSLTRVSNHINAEIPKVERTTAKSMETVQAELDILNSHVNELSGITGQLKPTIDGLNLMFRRDAVPAELLGLLGASKVAAGEVAKTMATVRDTVHDEAKPTATAIRQSAEHTAETTKATAEVTQTANTLLVNVNDMLFGPKTFKQKVLGLIRLLLGPAAILAAHGL